MREVEKLLDLECVEIWGCHGLERLARNRIIEFVSLTSKTFDALANARNLLIGQGFAEFIEDKPTGCAVHWRGLSAEQSGHLEASVEAAWETIGIEDSLQMLRFDGGIEICASAMNKGHVVSQILEELGALSSIAYLGDDETDEDAFRELQGKGLSVLVRESYRETSADIWIRSPDEVVEFLRDWASACRSET